MIKKMSDFAPFGEHDKSDEGTSKWPDEMIAVDLKRDPLGNQNEKPHSMG